jgi:glucosylceramidase
MHWTGIELRDFLRDHLGPTFAAEGISKDVGLFLSTFPVNDFAGYVQPSLNDSKAMAFLSGVGLQYAGAGMAAQIHKQVVTVDMSYMQY